METMRASRKFLRLQGAGGVPENESKSCPLLQTAFAETSATRIVVFPYHVFCAQTLRLDSHCDLEAHFALTGVQLLVRLRSSSAQLKLFSRQGFQVPRLSGAFSHFPLSRCAVRGESLQLSGHSGHFLVTTGQKKDTSSRSFNRFKLLRTSPTASIAQASSAHEARHK